MKISGKFLIKNISENREKQESSYKDSLLFLTISVQSVQIDAAFQQFSAYEIEYDAEYQIEERHGRE